MKLIISRQLPDSPPPQQGASDLISELTGTPFLPSNQHHFPKNKPY